MTISARDFYLFTRFSLPKIPNDKCGNQLCAVLITVNGFIICTEDLLLLLIGDSSRVITRGARCNWQSIFVLGKAIDGKWIHKTKKS